MVDSDLPLMEKLPEYRSPSRSFLRGGGGGDWILPLANDIYSPFNPSLHSSLSVPDTLEASSFAWVVARAYSILRSPEGAVVLFP